MMGPQEDYIEAVVICEGDFHDPQLEDRMNTFKQELESLILEDEKKHLFIKNVEPWNSVRVTFNIPRDAAIRLRELAEQRSDVLRRLGVLDVQILGHCISFKIAGANNQHTELILNTGDGAGQSSSSELSATVAGSSDDAQLPIPLEEREPVASENKTFKNIEDYLGSILTPSSESGASTANTSTDIGKSSSAAKEAVLHQNSFAGSQMDNAPRVPGFTPRLLHAQGIRTLRPEASFFSESGRVGASGCLSPRIPLADHGPVFQYKRGHNEFFGKRYSVPHHPQHNMSLQHPLEQHTLFHPPVQHPQPQFDNQPHPASSSHPQQSLNGQSMALPQTAILDDSLGLPPPPAYPHKPAGKANNVNRKRKKTAATSPLLTNLLKTEPVVGGNNALAPHSEGDRPKKKTTRRRRKDHPKIASGSNESAFSASVNNQSPIVDSLQTRSVEETGIDLNQCKPSSSVPGMHLGFSSVPTPAEYIKGSKCFSGTHPSTASAAPTVENQAAVHDPDSIINPVTGIMEPRHNVSDLCPVRERHIPPGSLPQKELTKRLVAEPNNSRMASEKADSRTAILGRIQAGTALPGGLREDQPRELPTAAGITLSSQAATTTHDKIVQHSHVISPKVTDVHVTVSSAPAHTYAASHSFLSQSVSAVPGKVSQSVTMKSPVTVSSCSVFSTASQASQPVLTALAASERQISYSNHPGHQLRPAVPHSDLGGCDGRVGVGVGRSLVVSDKGNYELVTDTDGPSAAKKLKLAPVVQRSPHPTASVVQPQNGSPALIGAASLPNISGTVQRFTEFVTNTSTSSPASNRMSDGDDNSNHSPVSQTDGIAGPSCLLDSNSTKVDHQDSGIGSLSERSDDTTPSDVGDGDFQMGISTSDPLVSTGSGKPGSSMRKGSVNCEKGPGAKEPPNMTVGCVQTSPHSADLFSKDALAHTTASTAVLTSDKLVPPDSLRQFPYTSEGLISQASQVAFAAHKEFGSVLVSATASGPQSQLQMKRVVSPHISHQMVHQNGPAPHPDVAQLHLAQSLRLPNMASSVHHPGAMTVPQEYVRLQHPRISQPSVQPLPHSQPGQQKLIHVSASSGPNPELNHPTRFTDSHPLLHPSTTVSGNPMNHASASVTLGELLQHPFVTSVGSGQVHYIPASAISKLGPPTSTQVMSNSVTNNQRFHHPRPGVPVNPGMPPRLTLPRTQGVRHSFAPGVNNLQLSACTPSVVQGIPRSSDSDNSASQPSPTGSTQAMHQPSTSVHNNQGLQNSANARNQALQHLFKFIPKSQVPRSASPAASSQVQILRPRSVPNNHSSMNLPPQTPVGQDLSHLLSIESLKHPGSTVPHNLGADAGQHLSRSLPGSLGQELFQSAHGMIMASSQTGGWTVSGTSQVIPSSAPLNLQNVSCSSSVQNVTAVLHNTQQDCTLGSFGPAAHPVPLCMANGMQGQRPPSNGNSQDIANNLQVRRPPSRGSGHSVANTVQVQRPSSNGSGHGVANNMQVQRPPSNGSGHGVANNVQVQRPPSNGSGHSVENTVQVQRPPSNGSGHGMANNVQVQRPPSNGSGHCLANSMLIQRPPSNGSGHGVANSMLVQRPPSNGSGHGVANSMLVQRPPSNGSGHGVANSMLVQRPPSNGSGHGVANSMLVQRPPSNGSGHGVANSMLVQRPPSNGSGHGVANSMLIQRPPSNGSGHSVANIVLVKRPPSTGSGHSVANNMQTVQRPSSNGSGHSVANSVLVRRPSSNGSGHGTANTMQVKRPPSNGSGHSMADNMLVQRPPNNGSNGNGVPLGSHPLTVPGHILLNQGTKISERLPHNLPNVSPTSLGSNSCSNPTFHSLPSCTTPSTDPVLAIAQKLSASVAEGMQLQHSGREAAASHVLSSGSTETRAANTHTVKAAESSSQQLQGEGSVSSQVNKTSLTLPSDLSCLSDYSADSFYNIDLTAFEKMLADNKQVTGTDSGLDGLPDLDSFNLGLQGGSSSGSGSVCTDTCGAPNITSMYSKPSGPINVNMLNHMYTQGLPQPRRLTESVQRLVRPLPNHERSSLPSLAQSLAHNSNGPASSGMTHAGAKPSESISMPSQGAPSSEIDEVRRRLIIDAIKGAQLAPNGVSYQLVPASVQLKPTPTPVAASDHLNSLSGSASGWPTGSPPLPLSLAPASVQQPRMNMTSSTVPSSVADPFSFSACFDTPVAPGQAQSQGSRDLQESVPTALPSGPIDLMSQPFAANQQPVLHPDPAAVAGGAVTATPGKKRTARSQKRKGGESAKVTRKRVTKEPR